MTGQTLDPVGESLLGALLANANPAATSTVMERLVPTDFHHREYQELFVRLRHQWAVGGIDLALLADDRWPLGELMRLVAADTWSSMAVVRYADELILRRRQLSAKGVVAQALTDLGQADDPAPVMLDLARRAEAEAWNSGRSDDDGWEHLSTHDLFDVPDGQADWVIPGLMRVGWRLLLAGEEGVGKDTLMRQIGQAAALGWDPFMGRTDGGTYARQRVLYVDVENKRTTIRHHTRLTTRNMHPQWAQEAASHYFTARPRAGYLNLAESGDQVRLETLIRKREPNLLIIGPVYRMFRVDPRDQENSTVAFLLMIDQLVTRYGFAVILHDHLAKGEGRHRPTDPIGSSAKLRWPEVGLTLHRPADDGGEYTLSEQRGGREPHMWPDRLRRGSSMGEWAWRAVPNMERSRPPHEWEARQA